MLFGISNPHNIFIRVDLPEPLEPLIPIKSPFSILKLIFLKMTFSSYPNVTFL